MRQLLILSLVLYELQGDSKLREVNMTGYTSISVQQQFLRVWPGGMDTCVTNVFCPNGKRRLFY